MKGSTTRLKPVVAGGTAIVLAIAASTIASAQAQTAPAGQQDAGSSPLPGSPADAPQTTPAPNNDIVVTGARASTQSSINAKRTDNVISDVLSAQDIGGLPATNVGDAIASMSGAATNRAKGSASEIDLEGLGPFLETTTLNGRTVTTGNGTRAVNFYVFPSQMLNKVAIYKTQRADLVEGGTSGTIDMRTVQPLDFKKQDLQLDVAGIKTGYDAKLRDEAGVDYRLTGDYIGQFDLGSLGELGVALGVQYQKSNSPEEDSTTSTTWVACSAAAPLAATATCPSITPQTYGTKTFPAGTPYYFATSSRSNIQMDTGEVRKALIGAIQWRVSPHFEINVDAELSRYRYVEDRQIFNLSETTRGITNPVFDADHVLDSYSGNSYGESTPTYRVQTESYNGGGINFAWHPNDRLKIGLDLSTANTKRERLDRAIRLRTNPTDIYGNVVPGVTTGSSGGRITYTDINSTDGTASLILNPAFDVTNPANFSAAARLRRTDQIRYDRVNAARIDGQYDVDGGFLHDLKFGGRYSELTYRSIEKDQREWDFNLGTTGTTATPFSGPPGTYTIALAQMAAINQACATPFPQRDFLAASGAQTVTSWASFNSLCLFNKFLGTTEPGPSADTTDPANARLTEQTTAGYLEADFATSLGRVGVTGNAGVRYVNVDLRSYGVRSDYNVVEDGAGGINITPTGNFAPTIASNHYHEWLPSLNASFDLTGRLKLRTGVYRSMTKADPFNLANGRVFTLNAGSSFADVASAIKSIAATGNPKIGPLLAWNEDLSLEFYPNRDSLFSVHVYHKSFQGGYTNTLQNESFTIGDQQFVVPVVTLAATNKTNVINGVELATAYRFSWLPAPLDGLGFKFNYSHAWSNYKQEDLNLGVQTDLTTGTVYSGLVPPVQIFGLSSDVVGATPYFQYKGFEISPVIKYRSAYYQQFIGAPSQNRVIRGETIVDLHVRYTLNRHASLFFDATNIFDTPQVEGQPIADSFQQASYFGPTYYAGIHFRF